MALLAQVKKVIK